ncbi:hypothetical protein EDC01DRAFT_97194 [Geopyxis carbonaria]|nr:hypothetical protein EDC01DRAFT_97194 [Geopyxis carbonaria]
MSSQVFEPPNKADAQYRLTFTTCTDTISSTTRVTSYQFVELFDGSRHRRNRHVCCCGYGIPPSKPPRRLPSPFPFLNDRHTAEIQLGSVRVLQEFTDNYNTSPTRPIRPLPKRRLRSRLSEDVNATLFVPPQQPATPLFYFPYNNYAGDSTMGGSGSMGFGSGNGMEDGLQDSSDEEDNANISISHGVGNGASEFADGTIGSTDPYEWTENTNNKKKRKIPTHTNPGGSTGGGGMSGSYNGTMHSSPGFSPTSTPRSRWRPNSSQRSPLSSISSANHVSLRRPVRQISSPAFDRGTNCRYKDGPPVTPSKVKRKDPGSDSCVPKQTQFTFVCESPISANVSYVPSGPSGGGGSGGASETAYPKSVHTVGTQTSPGISNSNATYQQPPQSTKKKPHKLSRREQFQQQQRRRRQALANVANNNGEIWICEFCEYESIFGTPPEALMRQYEIKDRKERRRLAEKRRLLEKAKQKSKKNSGKNAGKKAANHLNSAPPPPPPSTTDSQGTQSDNNPTAQPPALKPKRHNQQVQTDGCIESHHLSNGRGALTGSLKNGTNTDNPPA